MTGQNSTPLSSPLSLYEASAATDAMLLTVRVYFLIGDCQFLTRAWVGKFCDLINILLYL